MNAVLWLTAVYAEHLWNQYILKWKMKKWCIILYITYRVYA